MEGQKKPQTKKNLKSFALVGRPSYCDPRQCDINVSRITISPSPSNLDLPHPKINQLLCKDNFYFDFPKDQIDPDEENIRYSTFIDVSISSRRVQGRSTSSHCRSTPLFSLPFSLLPHLQEMQKKAKKAKKHSDSDSRKPNQSKTKKAIKDFSTSMNKTMEKTKLRLKRRNKSSITAHTNTTTFSHQKNPENRAPSSFDDSKPTAQSVPTDQLQQNQPSEVPNNDSHQIDTKNDTSEASENNTLSIAATSSFAHPETTSESALNESSSPSSQIPHSNSFYQPFHEESTHHHKPLPNMSRTIQPTSTYLESNPTLDLPVVKPAWHFNIPVQQSFSLQYLHNLRASYTPDRVERNLLVIKLVEIRSNLDEKSKTQEDHEHLSPRDPSDVYVRENSFEDMQDYLPEDHIDNKPKTQDSIKTSSDSKLIESKQKKFGLFKQKLSRKGKLQSVSDDSLRKATVANNGSIVDSLEDSSSPATEDDRLDRTERDSDSDHDDFFQDPVVSLPQPKPKPSNDDQDLQGLSWSDSEADTEHLEHLEHLEHIDIIEDVGTNSILSPLAIPAAIEPDVDEEQPQKFTTKALRKIQKIRSSLQTTKRTVAYCVLPLESVMNNPWVDSVPVLLSLTQSDFNTNDPQTAIPYENRNIRTLVDFGAPFIQLIVEVSSNPIQDGNHRDSSLKSSLRRSASLFASRMFTSKKKKQKKPGSSEDQSTSLHPVVPNFPPTADTHKSPPPEFVVQSSSSPPHPSLTTSFSSNNPESHHQSDSDIDLEPIIW